MQLNGKKIIELRWHGRAGQGAVTASKTLAQMMSSIGKCVQAFPEYGAEKRGAPVSAFNRISDSPIRNHSWVDEPQTVLVLDPTLLSSVDIAQGVPEDGTILVNCPETPAEIRERIHLQGRQLYTLDATKIALDTIGRDIPNVPMLCALIRVTQIIDFEKSKQILREQLESYYSQRIVEGNMKAADRGYNEVRGEYELERETAIMA